MRTHMNTHTHTNTQLASVFITQQEILGAGDREIEITSHLHFSKPLEPCHLCRASLLHLSPCLHKFYSRAQWNLFFFSLYTARYTSMWLSFKFCILTCFLQSGVSPWESQGARISAYLFDSHVSVFPSPSKGISGCSWQMLTSSDMSFAKYSIHLGVQILRLFY